MQTGLADLIDLYELSPMQQGMLFHALYQPGLYIEQRSCRLQGKLRCPAFKLAWQQAVNRHPILRTGFYWQEAEKPLQAVFSTAELLWTEQDWRHLNVDQQAEQLEAFLQADRGQEFELAQPPLMRCALFQLAAESYQFVWTHHHLLMDGWCNAILLQEVIAFYEAANQQRQLNLAPPPPYRNYISWLQQQDQGQAEQFWQQQLQGFTSPTSLSSAFTSASTPAANREQQLNLSETFTAQLQAFCQQQRLTLSTLIQAAWALLLGRYSHESDVVFGATVSGRPPDLQDVESMLGLFINTLPVRVQISDQALLPWLQQLQAQQLEREQYSYSSLIDIQAWSEIPRGLPLFESLIVFENYPVSMESALRGSHALTISESRGFAQTNYPITLSVIPAQALLIQIHYSQQFTSEFIAGLLKHFHLILQGIIKQPQQLSQISLITAAEQQQFADWNQTHRAFPALCVHQQFEVQAAQTPDAVALVDLVDQAESLTYGQLNAKANQLAHYLQSQGVQLGQRVGLCLNRSLDLLVSLIAILKAGAAYLPLDPAYPHERLAWMQAEAEATVVLTEPLLRRDAALIAQQPQQNLSRAVALDDLAYIIYTSGSTGQPKGVLVPHRALANYAFAAAEKFALTPNDRVLQFASINFDTAAEEIYPTLISGATLVLRTEEMIRTAATFLASCEQQQLSVLDLPTAYWHQLVRDIIAESLPLPAQLRLLIIGGEAADLACLSAWQAYTQKYIQNTQSPIRLLNSYGPTETTIVATWWEASDSTSTVPIGKPIPNVSTYVLDSTLNSVPIGLPGELYIGGAGLSQGYLNRPDLTAERFIAASEMRFPLAPRNQEETEPEPFKVPLSKGDLGGSSPDLQRLYKTGDRVRYKPDGNLEFLGRLDRQIKLRGFRIELGEIEAVLKQHSGIQDAVVLLQGNSAQGDAADSKLIAYLVPTVPPDLRVFLRRALPVQMIPAAFIALEALPLTRSGKIDFRSLPPLQPSPSQTAPRNPTEELLVGIWSNVLGVELGIHDNFFELGGHSLLATRVISQVRQVFGAEVPLRQLFEQPTIAEFAASLAAPERSAEGSSERSTAPITALPRSGNLPLSFAQQRQWFLAQLEPDSPLYNIPAAVQLRGTLNIIALQQSFNQVVRRHESLRTAILTLEGQPVQVVSPALQLELPLLDLTAIPAAVQPQQVEYLAAQEARQIIRLDQAPLLRVKLLKLSATEHIVLLTLHHLIADGWSMGLLVQELAALYSALIQGTHASLADLAIQYADFAVWQRSQQPRFEHQLAYWQQQLQDIPALDLPSDHPRPAVRSLRGERYEFVLSQVLTASLKQLSRQSGCTLFMTLLAGFQLLLHRYTGSPDLVVGTAIANRNRAEIEPLIGFFINALALRTDLSGNPTVEALLHRVREVALAAYAHQDLPFEQLVDALQPQRSLSYTPLLQVMFVLQNAPFSDLQVEGLQWTPLPHHSGTAKFDLTLTMQEANDRLTGGLEYSLDLFEAPTIQRLVGHLETLLSGMAADPAQHISELPLLTPAEQQQLWQWNQTQADYPQRCIHELFAAQAEQTPDAIALVDQDQQISYAELNQRANQLAHYLQTLGVRLEMPVAIALERSAHAVTAILGILKAGGVYLPLDLSTPAERLHFILKDAQVEFIIVDDRADNFYNVSITQVYLTDIQTESKINPSSFVTLDNLAYILYTSGSTGTPKGVCITHQNVVRLVKGVTYADLDSSEVILQAAPLAFDASTFEIWGALLNGGRLVLLSGSQPALSDFVQAITQQQVTTLWLTAGLFHLMVDERLASLKPLRQLLAGGDALSSLQVRKVRQAHPQIRLINGYGPTEGTTFSCCHSIADDDLDSASPPIGSPISNTQAYVLDKYLQPVPVGIPGELYIAGDGLARSYLSQPSLTAEKFGPSPSGSGGSATRLYETGDQVRYRPDGALEYLGRLDQQVKIRGFRVELGEVEAVLMQHPQVQAAAVMAQVLDPAESGYRPVGHKQLVAYLVLTEGEVPDGVSQMLRQFLLEKLPAYMVPALFVLLDYLPLTVNGKINRNALPAANLAQPNVTQAKRSLPSRTATETKLVEIWAAVLNRASVSIEDNFFELGGDSILAIQIISRANQAGLHLTPKQLFQHQTIAELATVAAFSSPIIAEQGIVTGQLPLTPIQHWFFEQDLPNPDHFNQTLLAEANLNPVWLAQAIWQLQQHHDALRLCFQSTETGWQQTIMPPSSSPPFTYFDYSAIPASQQSQLLEQAATQLQASLDLSAGVLMRSALFRLGNQLDSQPDRLLLIFHHLIIDGVSWRILLADLQTAYEQLSQQQPVQLPPKTTSYQQWAKQLAAYSSDLKRDSDWLSAQRRQVSSLPLDHPAGENTVAVTEQVEIGLSPAETQALLSEVPKAYNTKISEVLITALTLTLRQWSGNSDLLIDIEGHGRENLFEQLDISRTVGWFTTITPVLMKLETSDLGLALKQIKEQLRSLSNQGIEYGILRYLSDHAEELKSLPAAQISFNYLGQFDLATMKRANESVGMTQAPNCPRQYLFEITSSIEAGQLHLSWSYSRQQYAAATTAHLIETFHQTLLRLIEHCLSPDAGGYTPSDFGLAALDQSQLDALLATVKFGGEV